MHVAKITWKQMHKKKANFQDAFDCYPMLQNVAKCQVDKKTKLIKVIELESKKVITAFITTTCWCCLPIAREMKCVIEHSGAVQGNGKHEEYVVAKKNVLRIRQFEIKCLIASRMVQPNCSQQHECIYIESANFNLRFTKDRTCLWQWKINGDAWTCAKNMLMLVQPRLWIA